MKPHILIVLTTFVVEAYASCPSVTLVENFGSARFTGVWYEVQAQANSFNRVKSCSKSVYTLLETGFNVTTMGLTYSGRPTQSNATLTFKTNPAKMITSRVMGVRPPYEVLDTDYESYACVHSCIHMFFVYDYVFIYSRTRTLDQVHVGHCRALFSQYRTSSRNLHRLVNTNQGGCSN
ncbi:unnamed protein product [Meganyctiphanes norvegica]|uniref:Lipocalin/cytosolic fatty-acid binding domain-containing protein n=1 Tax=Meganyctiphanes norvegica TaxID=48144 RepID=A0AAV2S3W6_MEGNR